MAEHHSDRADSCILRSNYFSAIKLWLCVPSIRKAKNPFGASNHISNHKVAGADFSYLESRSRWGGMGDAGNCASDVPGVLYNFGKAIKAHVWVAPGEGMETSCRFFTHVFFGAADRS